MTIEKIDIVKLKELLNEHDYEVIADYPAKNADHVFVCEKIMFLYEPDVDRMSLAFHVTVKPDVSALTALEMSSALKKHIKHIHIMDSFYYSFNSEFKSGQEAFNSWGADVKRRHIINFMIKQQEDSMLHSNIGHEC